MKANELYQRAKAAEMLAALEMQLNQAAEAARHNPYLRTNYRQLAAFAAKRAGYHRSVIRKAQKQEAPNA